MERKKETKYERKTMNFIKEVLNYILLQEKLYLDTRKSIFAWLQKK